MQETFTHTHLLQSIYNELDTCEDFKLKTEITQNAELAEEFRELKRSKAILDSNELSPKSSTVKEILKRSKKNKEREFA